MGHGTLGSGTIVQINGYQCLKPLSSNSAAQAFLAERHTELYRIVFETPESSERIRRALLVDNPHVLKPVIIERTDLRVVTATPYCHGRCLGPQTFDSPHSLEHIPSFLIALSEAIAQSHRMGVPHGCLSWTTIYAPSPQNDEFAIANPNAFAIDLMDGLLFQNHPTATTEQIDFAKDVFSLGMLFQDVLTSDPQSPWRDHGLSELLGEMLVEDWASRPSAFEVTDSLKKNFATRSPNSPQSVSMAMGDFLSKETSTGDSNCNADATQELPAATVEAYSKELLVPANMPRLGRFAIERPLGEGGMGAVYLGRDDSNDTLVAIKVLSEHASKDEKATRRFAKEARLLATLDHPAVAKLIEFNRSGDTLYLAMEYVSGGSLADFTRTQQPLDESLVINAIADAARGLSIAHQNGMVHRDIKPANLLLTARGERSFQNKSIDLDDSEPLIKVADFGLAKHTDNAQSMAMTQTGMVLGTPLYMAPEQCRGQEVSPATDVYALGVTLFQCIAGKFPFDAPTAVEIFRMHCDAPLPKIRSIVGNASDAIQEVIDKCLAKNPNARYQNAGELLQDLEGLLAGTRTSIQLHPAIPDNNRQGLLSYQFQWHLRSSADALWPYISNTDRVNHAIGLPAVKYRTFQDPKLGTRRMATVRAMGMTMEWEEHPYEWVEGRRLSVLRQFPKGPFHWFTNCVELHPQSDGGTLVVQTLQMVPRNFMGKLFARFQIGNKSERNFGRVYEKIDEYLCSNVKSNPNANAFAPSKAITREQKRRLSDRFSLIRNAASSLDPKIVDTLEQYLEHASDIEVARLRPLAFAERFGLQADAVVEACLLAAREGALVLLWDILCPTCRIPSDVKETLKGLADHGHCEACNADFELDFAQSIELIFRAHPEIRTSETRTYCVGGPAFSSHVVAQVRLQRDERLNLQLSLSDGQYRLRGPQLPYVVDFRVAVSGRVGRLDLDLLRPIAKHAIPTFRSGEQVLSVLNTESDPRQIRIERLASRADALTAADAARLPAFREWFPDEVLSPGQLVSLTTVTLLGIQIAEAGKLYAELSDQAACSQILRRLQSIANLVVEHHGCVIKSMNDGLYTVFPSPGDAIAAATQLAKESLSWNISLKQSLHQGSAIVATINDRLDYFGETPQVLEDLMRTTQASEILMTAHCWRDGNVATILEPDWAIAMEEPMHNWLKFDIVRATPKQVDAL